MDVRSSIRAIRALTDGPEEFWDTAGADPDFDMQRFGEFVKGNFLFAWVGPLLEDDRFREALPPDLYSELLAGRATVRRRNPTLVDAARRLVAALDEAEIESLFLKGTVFAERFYRDPDRRHQWDVDVMVRRTALEPALAALGAAGFETAIDQETGKPMEERLERIRHPERGRVPHALGLQLGKVGVDLHWCLRFRALTPAQEEQLWSCRSKTSLAGTPVQTLSDEHTLMFLLLSCGGDIVRSRLRIKQLLDLYLLLRALERELDWDAFFAHREEEGLLRVCVNVLAVFVILWDCREEFPTLSRALEERRRLVELRDEAEAVLLMDRERDHSVWRRRLQPRSPWVDWVSRLTLDLPRTLSGLAPSGRFSGRLAPLEPEGQPQARGGGAGA